MTLTGIGVFRTAEGKLAEQWSEFDAPGMTQQHGVVPAMGKGEE